MVKVYSKSYSKEDDTFPRPYIYLTIPAFVIALLFNNKLTVMEVALYDFIDLKYNWFIDFLFKVLWTFSYNLEAVAILPQLYMMQKSSSETVEVLHQSN